MSQVNVDIWTQKLSGLTFDLSVNDFTIRTSDIRSCGTGSQPAGSAAAGQTSADEFRGNKTMFNVSCSVRDRTTKVTSHQHRKAADENGTVETHPGDLAAEPPQNHPDTEFLGGAFPQFVAAEFGLGPL